VTVPAWGWAGTLAVFAALIAADLAFARRAGRGLRAAAGLSVLWIAAAVAFGGLLWLWTGSPASGRPSPSCSCSSG
jgi:tellurite resistance protein TerC